MRRYQGTVLENQTKMQNIHTFSDHNVSIDKSNLLVSIKYIISP